MSTRATYRFHNSKFEVTFYSHTDGYPEGAAVKFWNMHLCKSPGGPATRFIKGNPKDVEITSDHLGHTDTDYSYDLLEGGQLRAYEREYNRWKLFFADDYSIFIEKYKETYLKYLEEYEKIYLIPYKENMIHATITEVREEMVKYYRLIAAGNKGFTPELQKLEELYKTLLKEKNDTKIYDNIYQPAYRFGR